MPTRYTHGARFYDVLSGEWPVYRIGRRVGIDALRLRPGNRVLDVGCGTGLNFPLLLATVGTAGSVVGVDASPAMLARACARVRRAGWGNVSLRLADAAQLRTALGPDPGFDAVLFTYALSIMPDWRDVWEQAWEALRPGGRAAVVDLTLPRGRGRVFALPARLACWTGGVDPTREPWRAVARDCVEVAEWSLRSGHIHVTAGARPN